jgi:hypothetical protein
MGRSESNGTATIQWNWEEKFAACQALGGECALKMRKPGDWYFAQRGVDIKSGPMLVGKFGQGATPQAAVEDHFRNLTELKSHEYVVINAYGIRRAVRWNGFMWADVSEETPESAQTVGAVRQS